MFAAQDDARGRRLGDELRILIGDVTFDVPHVYDRCELLLLQC